MKRIKKDDTSEGIDLKPVSDISHTKLLTKEAAFSKPFHVQNLTSPNLKHIHIKGYVDFYGGYAEHTRQVLDRLQDSGKYELKLTPIRTPIDIDPFVWNRMNTYICNPAFRLEESDFLCIAGPGHFQKDLLPKDRKIIGWTMIETLEASDEIKGWLDNCDLILCPTETDIRRFKGLHTTKVHLGYDQEFYNMNVKPIDISELRGRFVFGVLGSWNRRKGIKDIVQAFCREFKNNENVSLFLFCKYGTRPHIDPIYDRIKEDKDKWNINWELDRYLEEINVSRKEAPHICLLDVPVHTNLMPHLIKRMNVLTGFSMGESTWLPGLMAFAMGVPVIQLESACSGFIEYMNDDNSWLCKKVEYIDCIEEDYLGTSEYYEGGKFAKGDQEELMHMMRLLYKLDKYHVDMKIEIALEESKKWTWDKSIEQLNIILSE